MVDVAVREMTPQDADEVAAVEKECFSVPWSRESFWNEAKNENTLYLVAVAENKIVGYMGAWLLQGEAQITNIAVHPGFRRQGIGERLLTVFVAEIKARDVTAMTLEVRPSNAAALALYAKFGFKDYGRRRGYYIDNGEDAIIMWNTNLDGFG